MCILFLEYRPEDDGFPYSLVAACNRDAYFNKDTAPANFWDDNDDILAGRDLEKMGTWFGVSRNGRFGVVTTRLRNYGEPRSFDRRSRGVLVADFLNGEELCSDYCQSVEDESDEYDGFNLVVGRVGGPPHSQELMYYTNKESRGPEVLMPGTYGLSNEQLDSPWAKVLHGKNRFSEILSNACTESKEELTSQLLELLSDNTRYHPDPYGPTTNHPEEWMSAFSSVFMDCPEMGCGTRTSSVVLVDREGKVTFTERTMVQPINPFAPQWRTSTFSFKIQI